MATLVNGGREVAESSHVSPYDQRLARLIVRRFAHTGLHPNHVTGLSLLLGVASGLTFAFGPEDLTHLGALLFMLAVLVDHMDGELARMTGMTSTFGHYFDYLVGSLNYTILFAGIGVGLWRRDANEAALWVGLAAGLSNLAIVVLRLALERRHGAAAVAHPSASGFEIEDFIYLIGPITWLGGLVWFFWIYGLGTLGYLCWTGATLLCREVAKR